jgi:hypothetical protein
MSNMQRTNFQNNQFAPKMKDYAHIKVAANQGSVTNGTVVNFDTVVMLKGAITHDAANKRVTLKANKTYSILTGMRVTSGSAGYAQFQVYNVTAGAYVNSDIAEVYSANDTGVSTSIPLLPVSITPVVDTVIDVRIPLISGISLVAASDSFLIIQELDSYVQPNTYPFEVNANQVDLTVTLASWTTAVAKGIAYRTLDGQWRLRFNILGAMASGSRTSITLTVAGVVFKNTYSISGDTGQVVALTEARVSGLASTIVLVHASATTTEYKMSGDVPLNAAPSWI